MSEFSKSYRMNVREDISGNRYGKIKVIERADDVVHNNGDRYPAYYCECDCGSNCIKTAKYLKRCPNPCCDKCANIKKSESLHKNNTFIIKENYCEVLCDNSSQTIKIDLEDKDKVSQHCWYIHQSDRCDTLYYAFGRDRTERNHLKLHRFILGCDDNSFVVDHLNHDGLDNRKENLSVCFENENLWNKGKVKGGIPQRNITYCKNKNKYVVSFKRYCEWVYHKYCDTIEEAIRIRDEVEKIINEAYTTTQTICIDIDNIICNTTECVLNKINKICNTSYTISDVKEYSIESLLPEQQKHIVSDIFEDKSMWKNVEVIPYAIEVIRNLHMRGYKILFATATTSTNFNPKIRFLKRTFPFLDCENITICVKNKQILQCDYLIDDSPTQLLNGNYKGIALKYPWNENIDGFEKCDNWWDIYKIILTDHQQIHNAKFIKEYIKEHLKINETIKGE